MPAVKLRARQRESASTPDSASCSSGPGRVQRPGWRVLRLAWSRGRTGGHRVGRPDQYDCHAVTAARALDKGTSLPRRSLKKGAAPMNTAIKLCTAAGNQGAVRPIETRGFGAPAPWDTLTAFLDTRGCASPDASAGGTHCPCARYAQATRARARRENLGLSSP
jgi:hypothetical protein